MPPKILIVFHSTSSNVFRLARAITESVKEESAYVTVRRVAERVKG